MRSGVAAAAGDVGTKVSVDDAAEPREGFGDRRAVVEGESSASCPFQLGSDWADDGLRPMRERSVVRRMDCFRMVIVSSIRMLT